MNALDRVLATLDRRLARRYAPHVQCPDCGEHILVDHNISIKTHTGGAQELISDPDLGALWNHWAAHLDALETKDAQLRAYIEKLRTHLRSIPLFENKHDRRRRELGE